MRISQVGGWRKGQAGVVGLLLCHVSSCAGQRWWLGWVVVVVLRLKRQIRGKT